MVHPSLTDHSGTHRARAASLVAALLALLASVLAIGAAPVTAATNCSPSAGWGTNRSDLAGQVVALVNQYRASKGLGALASSPSLTASATWKSLHMAAYGYFAHSDPAPPVARSAFQRARDCDYTGGAWAENIAYGYPSAQAVMSGWLNSPGHRANIEGASFTSIGVGAAANASGTLYWTQNFGNDAGSPPPPPPPPAPAPPAPPAPSLPAPSSPLPGVPSAAPALQAPSPAGSPVVAPLQAPTPAPSPSGNQVPVQASGPTASAQLAVGGRPARISHASRSTRLLASVAFVQLATGKPLASAQVRCRAEIDGRRLRVLANVFKGEVARCAWRVPRWAKGKQLVGVVAVQLGQKAAIRLFKVRVT